MTRPPVFHFAIPFLAKDAARVQRTAASLLEQSAVVSGRASLRLSLVSDTEGLQLHAIHEAGPLAHIERVTESGTGIYGAVADAIEGSDADYFGYLGAGDTLEPQAFDVVLENAPRAQRAEPWWCTSYITTRREDGAIVRVTLPYRYRARFFETGLHGSLLPTVQQESTVWNTFLNRRIDFQRLRSFRLAGDYFLWMQFSRFIEPVVIEAVLGSFRWHGDNASSDWRLYQKEVAGVTRRPRLDDRLMALVDLAMWALPPRIRMRLAPSRIRRFQWPDGPWQSKA